MNFLFAFVYLCLQQTVSEPIETELKGTTLRKYETTGDANQGVGVNSEFIFAVTNRRISKIRKVTGKLLEQWDGEESFPTGHFDSGVVVGDKLLYVAQGNWPLWPMASTVEVFNIYTMKHVATHSFGIQLGSFTWMDRYNGYWWGGFASYDRYQRGAMDSYGKGHNVQVVKMDDNFQILEQFQIPDQVRRTFEIMSNSGGSWGPDGYLYLTGHDLPQVYAMALPKIGSVLHLAAVVDIPDIAGQGIAWDRSTDDRILYGIYRPNKTVIATEVPPIDDFIVEQMEGVVRFGAANFTT